MLNHIHIKWIQCRTLKTEHIAVEYECKDALNWVKSKMNEWMWDGDEEIQMQVECQAGMEYALHEIQIEL